MFKLLLIIRSISISNSRSHVCSAVLQDTVALRSSAVLFFLTSGLLPSSGRETAILAE